MTKVTGPLFSDDAKGDIADLGTFRRHGGSFQFIAFARGAGGHTDRQAALRQRFKAAKAAHSQIEPQWVAINGRRYFRRTPTWPDFWAQWLIDHPL